MATTTLVPVEEVRAVGDWRIWVRFEDGVAGEVDCRQLRDLPLFAPLKDKRVFDSVYVHPEWRVVCWGEGIELGPCGIYDFLANGGRAD